MGRFTGGSMPTKRIGWGNHVARCILPRWVLVTYMFNHATHHRGQLTTLMKQLGIDPGVTDLPWLPALYDGTVLSATQM
jgi:uncharacterized damage-inducible protein DinB